MSVFNELLIIKDGQILDLKMELLQALGTAQGNERMVDHEQYLYMEQRIRQLAKDVGVDIADCDHHDWLDQQYLDDLDSGEQVCGHCGTRRERAEDEEEADGCRAAI